MSHAWISSCASAFCVLRAGGRQWPPRDSPRALTQERGQSRQREQGNLDSSEQKVNTLGLCFISAASAQFHDTNLIGYPDCQWNRRSAGPAINLYFISGRKWSIVCPKLKILSVYSWKNRYSHCLFFTHILIQPLFLWHVTAEAAQLIGELLPPQATHTLVDLLTQMCPSLFFEGDCQEQRQQHLLYTFESHVSLAEKQLTLSGQHQSHGRRRADGFSLWEWLIERTIWHQQAGRRIFGLSSSWLPLFAFLVCLIHQLKIPTVFGKTEDVAKGQSPAPNHVYSVLDLLRSYQQKPDSFDIPSGLIKYLWLISTWTQ